MRKIVAIIASLVLLWGCKPNPYEDREPPVRDESITETTSFNNLFLDSIGIDAFLQNHPSFDTFTTQYHDFYKERNYEFAWFDSVGGSEQANNFFNLLQHSIEQLEDSSLYNKLVYDAYEKAINSSKSKVKNAQANFSEAELLLTGQFFSYAAKVYAGSQVDATQLGWFIPRKKVDVKNILDSAIKVKSKADYNFGQLHPQYKKLQNFLEKFVALRKKYDWDNDTIPIPPKAYKQGDSSHAIQSIKQRLFAYGDLQNEETSAHYDETLLTAVKSFQKRNGLAVDGAIGPAMIKQLNDSLDTKIRTILVNMERARWMPKVEDSIYIYVNIPEYKLAVYLHDTIHKKMNVIVGSEANNTVIFSGNLRYIVFSPYWNVPYSIVKKEIAPKIATDRNYLARNNMETYGGKVGGLPQIRQKPGPTNSLGLVKFLFPNNYNIYLHDTPNRGLFENNKRNLSHGCVRIGEPKWLANFLLKEDAAWNDSTIETAMHLAKEKWVTLKKPIKVVIAYFTAWVDDNGTLNFRKDIYGHDKIMANKLFAK